jgi:hypothetical protein
LSHWAGNGVTSTSAANSVRQVISSPRDHIIFGFGELKDRSAETLRSKAGLETFF